jgi:hypothetical protein
MIRTEVEEIIRFLEENLLPYTPEVIREVARERVEEGVEGVVWGVLEEGRRRTLEVYDKVWEVLELPPLPEAREFIERGGEVHVSYPRVRGNTERPKVEVTLVGKTKAGDVLRLPAPARPIEEVDFHFETGRVEVHTDSKLLVKGSWAFFKAPSVEAVKRARRSAAFLHPVFTAMGLPDLEEALSTLDALRGGEVLVEGEYLLARGKGFWFLNRKSILGDPALDEALPMGREVVLTFPEDVEIAFRLDLDRDWARNGNMRLSPLRFRLGEEVATFDNTIVFSGEVLRKEVLVTALQQLLEMEISFLEAGRGSHLDGVSTRMLVFLKTFAKHKDPLGALEEGRFSPHTVAEMFMDM